MLRDAPPLKQTSCSSPLAHLSRRPCPVAAVAERREAESRPPARPAQENSWLPWVQAGASAGTRSHHTAVLEAAPQAGGFAGEIHPGPGGGPGRLARPSCTTKLNSKFPGAAAARCRSRCHRAGSRQDVLLDQPSPGPSGRNSPPGDLVSLGQRLILFAEPSSIQNSPA